MAKKKKWIQKAISSPGALHRALGIKQEKKIPSKMLNEAAGRTGRIGKMARLAKTLKKMPKRGRKKRGKK